MSQIREYIKIAIMNIRHNRGRSILTMLGIIIGISSVIMVLSIGGGVKSEIGTELEKMAGGQVCVYVDTTRKETTVYFDESDVEALEELDHVKGAGPNFSHWGTVVGPKDSMDVLSIGGNESLVYNTNDPIVRGSYFTESDFEMGNLVGIINESDAKKLFGTTDIIGLTVEVTINNISQDVTIIGIRKQPEGKFLGMLTGQDSYVQVEMPYTAMEYKFNLDYSKMSSIYLYGEKSEYGGEIANNSKTILESRHNCAGENQVMVEKFSDASAQYDSILSIITVFVSLVAAISLLVGGIGVMNIMLVSVTERTREIGIRKSLGARTRSIMIQFLAEAGIISCIGGIIGIILGVGGALLACKIADFPPDINIFTIIFTTIFSCGVGIFFGIYPAKKAAKLRPIEALRHE